MPILRSVLDTEYESWPITTPPGVSIVGDQGFVAFVARKYDTPDTWYPADIVVDSVRYGDTTPRLRILIGPQNGGVVLAAGLWHILGKISDSPEVPVKYLDYIVLR